MTHAEEAVRAEAKRRNARSDPRTSSVPSSANRLSPEAVRSRRRFLVLEISDDRDQRDDSSASTP